MRSRGTTRKAFSISAHTYERLKAYLARTRGSQSNFVETLLAETYPNIFGPNAPPPPPLTLDEEIQKNKRQKVARDREDKKRGVFAESPFTPVTRDKPDESSEDVKPRDPSKPQEHLQPKPDPSLNSQEGDDEDPPTGVILL